MKRKLIPIATLCFLLSLTFTACGREDNGSNNNSVTEGTYGQTAAPSPTLTPTGIPGSHSGTEDNSGNLGNEIINGAEDIGNGVINGVDDVIDGVDDALDGNGTR